MKISEPQHQSSFNGKDGDLQRDKVSKRSFAFWIAAIKFTDNTTMHGLRYVFRSDTNIIRRLIWLSFILGGMTYCIYIMSRSVSYYFEYPTVMRTKTKYEASSVFPVVTMCSYNMYHVAATPFKLNTYKTRKSKLSEEEQRMVAHLFPLSIADMTAKNVNFSKYDDMDVIEFTKKASFHNKPDWCLFNTKVCTPDIMGLTLTDMGFCMKFGAKTSNWTQTNSGLYAGLDVVIMAQSDSEWTAGPYMYYTGFRVAVDQQEGGESSSLRDRGFSMIPEVVTDAVLTRKEITLLPPPHGQCGEVKLASYERYTHRDCLVECEKNFSLRLCGCRYFYQAGKEALCTFSQLHDCLEKAREFHTNASKVKFNYANCNCPQECFHVEYSVSVTATQRSKQFSSYLMTTSGFDPSHGTELRLYYQSLEYTEVTEEAIYTFENLMCDIGGAGGLFLGCSFATIFEFFDFSFDIFWLWFYKRSRQPRRNRIYSIKE